MLFRSHMTESSGDVDRHSLTEYAQSLVATDPDAYFYNTKNYPHFEEFLSYSLPSFADRYAKKQSSVQHEFEQLLEACAFVGIDLETCMPSPKHVANPTMGAILWAINRYLHREGPREQDVVNPRWSRLVNIRRLCRRIQAMKRKPEPARPSHLEQEMQRQREELEQEKLFMERHMAEKEHLLYQQLAEKEQFVATQMEKLSLMQKEIESGKRSVKYRHTKNLQEELKLQHQEDNLRRVQESIEPLPDLSYCKYGKKEGKNPPTPTYFAPQHKPVRQPLDEDMQVPKATSRAEWDAQSSSTNASNLSILRVLEGRSDRANARKQQVLADIQSRFRDPNPELQQEIEGLKLQSYDQLREVDTHLELRQRTFLKRIRTASPDSALHDMVQQYVDIYPDVPGVIAANHTSEIQMGLVLGEVKGRGKIPTPVGDTQPVMGEPQIQDIIMCHGTQVYTPTWKRGVIESTNDSINLNSELVSVASKGKTVWRGNIAQLSLLGRPQDYPFPALYTKLDDAKIARRRAQMKNLRVDKGATQKAKIGRAHV